MIFWHFRFSSLTQHILMTEGFLNSNWFADHLSRQMQQKMNGKMKQISFSKCLLDLGPDSFPWELVELIIHLISYSEILESCAPCLACAQISWLYAVCVECYCVNWIKCLCSRYLKAGRWGRGGIYLHLPPSPYRQAFFVEINLHSFHWESAVEKWNKVSDVK